MNERGFVTVSMRELERIKIIAAVAEHRLKVVQAAERLDLCERQVSRLVRRYETNGSVAIRTVGREISI
jgi:transcriptional regulator with GAF, ATPase, and Fis domain